MKEFHKTLPLGVKFQDALPFIGCLVEKNNPEAAQLCRDLLHALPPDAEVTVQVPIVHVLCQACDELRAKTQPDLVELVERLIASLKAGEQQLITGTFKFAPRNAGELDRQLEALRSHLLKER